MAALSKLWSCCCHPRRGAAISDEALNARLAGKPPPRRKSQPPIYANGKQPTSAAVPRATTTATGHKRRKSGHEEKDTERRHRDNRHRSRNDRDSKPRRRHTVGAESAPSGDLDLKRSRSDALNTLNGAPRSSEKRRKRHAAGDDHSPTRRKHADPERRRRHHSDSVRKSKSSNVDSTRHKSSTIDSTRPKSSHNDSRRKSSTKSSTLASSDRRRRSQIDHRPDPLQPPRSYRRAESYNPDSSAEAAAARSARRRRPDDSDRPRSSHGAVNVEYPHPPRPAQPDFSQHHRDYSPPPSPVSPPSPHQKDSGIDTSPPSKFKPAHVRRRSHIEILGSETDLKRLPSRRTSNPPRARIDLLTNPVLATSFRAVPSVGSFHSRRSLGDFIDGEGKREKGTWGEEGDADDESAEEVGVVRNRSRRRGEGKSTKERTRKESNGTAGEVGSRLEMLGLKPPVDVGGSEDGMRVRDAGAREVRMGLVDVAGEERASVREVGEGGESLLASTVGRER